MSTRGGKRRHQVPPCITPEQVRWAAAQIAAGRLVKQICHDLNCHRSTLWRALTGKGQYAGILGHAQKPLGESP